LSAVSLSYIVEDLVNIWTGGQVTQGRHPLCHETLPRPGGDRVVKRQRTRIHLKTKVGKGKKNTRHHSRTTQQKLEKKCLTYERAREIPGKALYDKAYLLEHLGVPGR